MTFFENTLKQKFNPAGCKAVLETLKELGLPAPEECEEYIFATSGVIMFLDEYACSVRIEFTQDHITNSLRVDHSLILQPLGTLEVNDITIEITPGIRTTNSEELSEEVCDILKDDGIWYWDSHHTNVGLLPLKTVDFPEGVPVVLDRLAVRALEGAEQLKESKSLEDNSFQDRLYGELRKSFEGFKSGKNPVGKFWSDCLKAKAEYKLFPGWQYYNNKQQLFSKQGEALKTGQAYAERLKKNLPHI